MPCAKPSPAVTADSSVTAKLPPVGLALIHLPWSPATTEYADVRDTIGVTGSAVVAVSGTATAPGTLSCVAITAPSASLMTTL